MSQIPYGNQDVPEVQTCTTCERLGFRCVAPGVGARACRFCSHTRYADKCDWARNARIDESSHSSGTTDGNAGRLSIDDDDDDDADYENETGNYYSEETSRGVEDTRALGDSNAPSPWGAAATNNWVPQQKPFGHGGWGDTFSKRPGTQWPPSGGSPSNQGWKSYSQKTYKLD